MGNVKHNMLDDKLVRLVVENDLGRELFRGRFGLEKENIRVNGGGELAFTPHPEAFGGKRENPYIKVDFSESQLEMITPAMDTIEEAHQMLEAIHDIVTLELLEQSEYLWPSSNPPALPKDDEDIPIARMDDPAEDRYRQQLADKYGRRRQLMSGIHYNFSFGDALVEMLFRAQQEVTDYRAFKDSLYVKVARNALRYRWLLIYLTGASPVFNKTYIEQCVQWGEVFDEDSRYYPAMTSFRNSLCGYRNKKQLHVSYSTLQGYVSDLRALVESGELISAREYYSSVRLKPAVSGGDMLEGLLQHGVGYLELRVLDLNPLHKIGISQETMRLVHLFLVYILLLKEEPFNGEAQMAADLHHEEASLRGLTGTDESLQEKALLMLEEMEQLARVFLPACDDYITAAQNARSKVEHPALGNASVIKREMQEASLTYLGYHLSKAQQYAAESQLRPYTFPGYEDLELSTQLLLKAAVKCGVAFELLDRDDNFVRLSKGSRIEYVKQATKTSLDSYITMLMMENKVVTKKVLEQHGIRVPRGNVYSSLDEAVSDYKLHLGGRIVVKPKSTNFGLGITIFKEGCSQEDYEAALRMAFAHDRTVLIEEFVSGKECRFLIMGDETVGILHRVPANVVGDGVHTIEQLVDIKNRDPLRGKGYKTPLEKIELGEAEMMFLKGQSRTVQDIPAAGEVVYLRENSNISTGGDSIDYTDDIPDSYKRIAVRSAKAAGAVLCGVDMVIERIEEEASDSNYSIIELNFNPAIHIHCYPYLGVNRRANEKVLDLLF